MAGQDPVMRVFHDHDGDWQFHGAGESSPDSGVLSCFHCIVKRDGSLMKLADLPVGWAAWRDDLQGEWHREAYQRSEE